MRLEEYTPDAICQAMGLPGFVEMQWRSADIPTLRVLLTPAFGTELCITLAPASDSVSLRVVALIDRFWQSPHGIYLRSCREEASLAINILEEASAHFRSAKAAFVPDRRSVVIDGMGLESCLISRELNERISENVGAVKPLADFTSAILETAWKACSDPRVKNAISSAAEYVGIKHEKLEEPLQPPVTRLAVLGDEADRQAVLKALQRTAKNCQN